MTVSVQAIKNLQNICSFMTQQNITGEYKSEERTLYIDGIFQPFISGGDI
jgi:hypothetical protein